MKYKLKILPKAEVEWKKLDEDIKNQFRKQIKNRQENPFVEKDKLKKFKDVYKIKLRKKAYRLAYKIDRKEKTLIILIIAKRDVIYKKIKERF